MSELEYWSRQVRRDLDRLAEVAAGDDQDKAEFQRLREELEAKLDRIDQEIQTARSVGQDRLRDVEDRAAQSRQEAQRLFSELRGRVGGHPDEQGDPSIGT